MQEEDKKEEGKNQPDEESGKDSKKDGGFGSSGTYFDKDRGPNADKTQTNADQPAAQEPNKKPDSSDILNSSQTPHVDSFSPPESETGEELKMPSEEDLQKGPSEPEPKADQPEAEEAPAEDIFEESSKLKAQSSKPEEMFKTPEEKKPPKEEPFGGKEERKEEPAKKGGGRKTCCIFFIILFVIILLLAALVFVNEWGILNLGIEKYYGRIKLETLWGGLPIDGKIAAAKSWQKMQNENYTLAGELKTSFKSKEIQAINLTPQTFSAKIAEPSKYEINSSYNLVALEPFLKDLNLDLDLTLVEIDYLRDGDSIYIKNEEMNSVLANKKDWYKIKFEGESKKSLEKTNLDDYSDALEGERTAWKEINGVPCYVYEYRADLAKIFGSSLGLEQADLKLYLGKRDKLVRKVVLSYEDKLSGYTYKIESSLDFGDYESEVKVTTPSENKYTEISFSGFKENVVNKLLLGELNGTLFKDTTRKNDIDSISEALENYKSEVGSYPDTEGEVVKTRDSGTVLEKALVSDYLAELPTDPDDPDFWYGYIGDGSSYEVWAVLNNSDDPEGEEYKGYWIYKISS